MGGDCKERSRDLYGISEVKVVRVALLSRADHYKILSSGKHVRLLRRCKSFTENKTNYVNPSGIDVKLIPGGGSGTDVFQGGA